MVLVVILFLLQFIIFNSEVEAQAQNYQFVLVDNSINLELFKPLDFLPTETGDIKDSNNLHPSFLQFAYQIEADQDLPSDIPLFLLAFDRQVVFFADSNQADGLEHQVQIDLKDYFKDEENWSLPVFYQNQYFNDLQLKLHKLSFLEDYSLPLSSSVAINDLTAIEETDGSLTLLFSLVEKNKQRHVYELLCLDQKSQKLLSSKKLLRNDEFLWPNFNFSNLLSNQKQELIFHLSDFVCDEEIVVLLDGELRSQATQMIRVSDL